ncbi:MAG: heat-inducible transcriptional repressor HrcA [Holosporales bacterium]|jgi:heat-inducible transcriptional repressor|nr:heat-inducible transcriptional repressor HrcA [Holosporales bacterium]
MNRSDISKNKRYVDVFKKLVDIYVETGEPVGSRCLSKTLCTPLSPATIRNVMADLEDIGILCSAHSSSGRKPTEKGWRFFVNALVETASISEIEERALSEITKNSTGKSIESILENATNILSELSNCVSLISTPTINLSIKHIDFVLLNPEKAIVIIVNENGLVENRLIDVPMGISVSVLEQARNYINEKLTGMNLKGIRDSIQDELNSQKDGINTLAKEFMASGIDIIENEKGSEKIIVKGQSNLISKANEIKELEFLLKKLDEKRTLKNILDESINGAGIQIFIGSETKMFEMIGCSMIVSSYHDSNKKLIGTIGIIGPTRMRYSRAMTLVDYTAKLIGSLI